MSLTPVLNLNLKPGLWRQTGVFERVLPVSLQVRTTSLCWCGPLSPGRFLPTRPFATCPKPSKDLSNRSRATFFFQDILPCETFYRWNHWLASWCLRLSQLRANSWQFLSTLTFFLCASDCFDASAVVWAWKFNNTHASVSSQCELVFGLIF